MTLMSWLRELINGPKEPDDRFAEAAQVLDDVGSISRDLRYRLEPYRKADDPFIAIWADTYENRQIANLYKGPTG